MVRVGARVGGREVLQELQAEVGRLLVEAGDGRLLGARWRRVHQLVADGRLLDGLGDGERLRLLQMHARHLQQNAQYYFREIQMNSGNSLKKQK